MDKYGILWIQIIESSFLEGFQQPFFLEKISTHGKKRERELEKGELQGNFVFQNLKERQLK